MDLFERGEVINQQEVERRKKRDEDYEIYKGDGRIWGVLPREWIKTISFPRLDKSIIEGYKNLPDLTSSISDILDQHGINGTVSATNLKPLISGKRIVGQAFTLRSVPERKTTTQCYIDNDLIKTSQRDIFPLGEEGDILVSEFAAPDISSMGFMASSVAKTYGFSGAIVNGWIRDVNQIYDIDFPVWSRGVTPKSGKFRMETIELNGPVVVHDIQVIPGDLIVADETGICAIPYEMAEIVLNKLIELSNAEDKLDQMMKAKRPLDEIREVFRKRYC